MKTYYKVLTIEPDNRLTSICQIDDVVGYDREKALEYLPNQWTRPIIEGSKLFVFDSYLHAIKFAEKMDCTRSAIWECQVKNPLRMNRIASVRSWYIEEFWYVWMDAKARHANIRNLVSDFAHTFNAPNGTFGASAVKLTKEVYRKY